MDKTQLALEDYFSIRRVDELHIATWEEIDAVAEKILGMKP